MKEPKIDFKINYDSGVVSISVDDNPIVKWVSDDGDPEPLVESFTTVFQAGMDYNKNDVLNEVSAERVRQDEKWGGTEHDDTHNFCDWANYINDHLEDAVIDFNHADVSKARKELIEVAALVVAAIESMDRKILKESP